MRNDCHIKELKNGVEAWNQWRTRNPDIKPDLSGTDFPEERITDLKGANLRDANLSGVVLNHCTDMTGANLANVAIAGTRLLCAKLWEDQARCCKDQARRPFRTDKRGSICSVGELISACECLSRSCKKERVLYFRGHETTSYQLRPSLTRAVSCQDQRTLLSHESEMLTDLMSRRPEDFERQTTALDQWGLARHHGLPTRLLDVTKNPLVALYNACEEVNDKKNRENGVVHVFAVPREMIKTFGSDTISVICNFAKLTPEKQRLILGEDGRCGESTAIDNYYRARGDLYHHIREERSNLQELIDPRHLFQVFVVEPRESFARVRAQAGAFLISASHSTPSERGACSENESGCESVHESATIEFEPERILCRIGKHNGGMPMYEHCTFTVPHSEKCKIRNQLKMLQISAETLFPGLDESANAALTRAKDRM